MIRFVLVFITFCLLVFSCKKKTQAAQASQNNPVPYVPVDITVYPNDPLNFSIQGIGGWKYIVGGINGIILYRKSQEEFVAVERTSSQDPNNPAAKVKVQADNFTCKDTISNSKWRIFDGAVTEGPATWPLRVYGTTYDGTTLRIRN
jgi:hypothetical protein